jgi:hypothetical protein
VRLLRVLRSGPRLQVPPGVHSERTRSVPPTIDLHSNGDGIAASMREKEQAVAATARAAGLAVKEREQDRAQRPEGGNARAWLHAARPDWPAPLTRETARPRAHLARLLRRRVRPVRGAYAGPCAAPPRWSARCHDQPRRPRREQRKSSPARDRVPRSLQRSWGVSKQYGMFATPIAYLIDPSGTIAHDVAVGGEAILELAAP